jgi:hypothetical protein
MADLNADIHHHISALIAEEHRLRANEESLPEAERRCRLTEVERQLDQTWDLLRQREARREFNQDPRLAQQRSERVVESYEG